MNYRQLILTFIFTTLMIVRLAASFTSNGQIWHKYSNGTVKQRKNNEFLIIDDSATAGAGIFYVGPAEAGKHYRASAEMMTLSKSKDGVFIQIRYLPSKKIHQQNIILPDDNKFHKYMLSAPAPAGTKSMHVYFYAHPGKIKFKLRNPEVKLQKSLKFDRNLLRKRPTGLILNKAVASLVVPADGSLDYLAQQIREATKIDFPIIKKRPRICEGNIYIALGNRNNNPLISYLYDCYYCIIDLRYPGKGGHVLRTLFNPAGDNINYILLGGSDEEGVQTAVDHLIKRIKNKTAENKKIKLPFIWDVKLSPMYKLPRNIYRADTYDQSEGYGTRYFGWSVLSRYMAMFYATGDEKYARNFLQLAFPKTKADFAAINRDPTAFKTKDDPLGAPYHYNAPMANIYWNMIENHPVFSDKERAKVAKAMFRQFIFWRDTSEGGGVYQLGSPRNRVGNRHKQWAAISLYSVARYLNKVLPNDEFIYAQNAAKNLFDSINHYLWVEGEGGNLTWYPSGIEPVPFFMLLSGQRDKAADSALKTLFESLETLCGNTRDGRIIQYVPLSLLRRTAYLLQNSAPLEIEKIIKPNLSPQKFRLGQSFKPLPEEYPHNSFHKPRHWYFNRPSSQVEKSAWGMPFPDKDAAFSIASWRENNHGGDFILVDGHLDTILRQPLHAMTLFTLTLDKLPLLAGYRNQLWARKDGLALSKLPRAAHLDNYLAMGKAAGLSSSLPISKTAKWKRSFLHRPSFCLVADQIFEKKRKQQTYDLKINWEHGPGLKQVLSDQSGQIRLKSDTINKNICDYYVDAKSNYHTEPAEAKTVLLRGGVKALLFKGQKLGQRLIISFKTSKTFNGKANIRFYGYIDRGSCNIYLDNKLLRKNFSIYSAHPEIIDLKLDNVQLAAGEHKLILESSAPSSKNKHKFSIGFISFSLSSKPLMFPEGSISFCDPLRPQLEKHKGNLQDKLTGKLSVYSFAIQVSSTTPATVFTLLSSLPADKVSCQRINSHAALLSLPQVALVVCGQLKAPQLKGEMLIAAEKFISGFQVKRVGDLLRSPKPVDIDWSLDSGELRIKTKRTIKIELAGKVYKLKKGINKLLIKPNSELLQKYSAGLKGLKTKPLNKQGSKPLIMGQELKPEKILQLNAFPTASLIFQNSMAVSSGKKIRIFDSNLREISSMTADSIVGKLHYVNESKQLLAGCVDEKVIAFNPATGKRKWTFVSKMAPGLKETGAVWYFKSAHPGIYGLSSGKFINKKELIFVGSASTLEVIDLKGNLVKRQKILWGPVWQFALFPPLDKPRLAMAQVYPGSEYLTCFTPNFKKIIGFNMPPPEAESFKLWACSNRTNIDVVDLDNDNSMKVISGINGFWNRIIVWDINGKPIREVSFGPGYSIRVASYGKQRLERRFLSDVKLLQKNGNRQILAAVEDSLIMFSHKLEKSWRKRLPAQPLITVLANGRIATGCRDGSLLFFDFNGKVLGYYKNNDPWVEMQFLDKCLLAVDAKGKLCRFKID
jgi:hypothetical protein